MTLVPGGGAAVVPLACLFATPFPFPFPPPLPFFRQAFSQSPKK